jgi:hypothetical protein
MGLCFVIFKQSKNKRQERKIKEVIIFSLSETLILNLNPFMKDTKSIHTHGPLLSQVIKAHFLNRQKGAGAFCIPD